VLLRARREQAAEVRRVEEAEAQANHQVQMDLVRRRSQLEIDEARHRHQLFIQDQRDSFAVLEEEIRNRNWIQILDPLRRAFEHAVAPLTELVVPPTDFPVEPVGPAVGRAPTPERPRLDEGEGAETAVEVERRGAPTQMNVYNYDGALIVGNDGIVALARSQNEQNMRNWDALRVASGNAT
jgi:hypothetical protein